MSEPHWTDNASSTPIFSTVIDATGWRGNIFSILGAATVMLRQLDIPRYRIAKLRTDVMEAGSYDAAVALIERWFPVDRGESHE